MAGIGIFKILCPLTDNGVKHVDDIIKFIFQVSFQVKKVK